MASNSRIFPLNRTIQPTVRSEGQRFAPIHTFSLFNYKQVVAISENTTRNQVQTNEQTELNYMQLFVNPSFKPPKSNLENELRSFDNIPSFQKYTSELL